MRLAKDGGSCLRPVNRKDVRFVNDKSVRELHMSTIKEVTWEALRCSPYGLFHKLNALSEQEKNNGIDVMLSVVTSWYL